MQDEKQWMDEELSADALIDKTIAERANNLFNIINNREVKPVVTTKNGEDIVDVAETIQAEVDRVMLETMAGLFEDEEKPADEPTAEEDAPEESAPAEEVAQTEEPTAQEMPQTDEEAEAPTTELVAFDTPVEETADETNEDEDDEVFDFTDMFKNMTVIAMKFLMNLTPDEHVALDADVTEAENGQIQASIPALVDVLFNRIQHQTIKPVFGYRAIQDAVRATTSIMPDVCDEELKDIAVTTICDELALRLLNGYAPAVEEPVAPAVTPAVEEAVVEQKPLTVPKHDEDVMPTLKADYKPVWFNVMQEPNRYQAILKEQQEGKTYVVHRYESSFNARMSEADDSVKGYYDRLKNLILSYKTVSSRISNDFESFNRGHVKVVKMNTTGKTLFVYLALDPKAYEGTKYAPVDVSEKKRFAEVPLLMKVKGERKLKYTEELITTLMEEQLGLEVNSRYETSDFKPETFDRNVMLQLGYMKKFAAGIPLDEVDEAYLNNLRFIETSDAKPVEAPVEAVTEAVAKQPAEEVAQAPAEVTEAVVEEPVEETVTEEKDDFPFAKPSATALETVEPTEEEKNASFKLSYFNVRQEPERYALLLDEEKNGETFISYRYVTSFTSRMTLASETVQNYYSELKNLILSYRDVSNRISNEYEAFNRGHVKAVKMNTTGKTLYVYLALNPEDYKGTKYAPVDKSKTKKYAETPLLMKVKGDRKLKYTKELLVKLLSEDLALKEKKNFEAVNYNMPNVSVNALIDDGSIKMTACGVPMALTAKDEKGNTILAETGEILPNGDKAFANAFMDDEDFNESDGNSFFDVKLDFINIDENPDAYRRLQRREREGRAVLERRKEKTFTYNVATAEPEIKDYYNAIKNYLLSFKGISDRISKDYESFNHGRDQAVKINSTGKSLYVYVALNPADYEGTKYAPVDVSSKKKYADVPLLMKVKGDRKFKYTMELLKVLVEGYELKPVKDYVETDYRIPMTSEKQMVRDGFLKRFVAEVPKTK